MPHPAVQIFLWLCLVLATQTLSGYTLLLLAGLSILLSIIINASRFFIILRRTRWIMLSMFAIYSYIGTGDVLWPQLGAFSPLVLGVHEGFVQLLRLLVILSSLSLLLSLLDQSRLVSGLFRILYVFELFGFNCDRFMVRLVLTIRHVESAILDTAGSWRGNFEKMLHPVAVEPGYIEADATPLNRRDWLIIVAATLLLAGVWQ